MRAQTRRAAAKLALACFAVLSATSALALDPDEGDVAVIVAALSRRNDGNHRVEVLDIEQSDVAGRMRRRQVQVRTLDFPGETRALWLWLAPDEVRGTQLLTIDPHDPEAEGARVLRLSKLGATPPLMTGHTDFGDLSAVRADLTPTGLGPNHVRVLNGATQLGDESCWLLEVQPDAGTRERTGIEQSHLWVSRDKLVVVQAKHWLSHPRRLQLVRLSRFEKVDGVWVSRHREASLLRGTRLESRTRIDVREVRFDPAAMQPREFDAAALSQASP